MIPLLGLLVERIQERMATISTEVATQEAQTVIEEYLGVDPSEAMFEELPPARKYRILSGLTLWALARAIIATSISTGEYERVQIGLLSASKGSNESKKWSVDQLLEQANWFLGFDTGHVLRLTPAALCESVYSVRLP